MKGLARLISDPIFVLDSHGAVLDLNRPARVLLGETALVGAPAFEDDAGFRALFAAASGSSDPVIGSAKLRLIPPTSHRSRVRAVVTERSPALSVAIQVLDTRDDQFVLLSKRVKDLNREIAQRAAIQARLEESLRQNAVFYRELQHRVKNHLQMMLGLFAAARRETRNAEALDHLRRLEIKLQAVFEAQRLMYLPAKSGVPADELLGSMARVLSALAGEDVKIEIEAHPVQIPDEAAFPVALIINELLSNAVKYGVPNGGRIRASVHREDGELELCVQDWGPGMSSPSNDRKSSGLGLVRGLCRQIGGRLEISSEGGTSARIRFPAEI